MGTGLARAALRAHRPAFVGTAVAALFARARRQITENGVGDMALVLLIGSIYMSIFVIAPTMGTGPARGAGNCANGQERTRTRHRTAPPAKRHRTAPSGEAPPRYCGAPRHPETGSANFATSRSVNDA
ncbi:hypothetical protein GCM10010277_41880 [Streptomyces longisporoflavus]|uniref:hypothetical protein n=1 Tax=Streptomyces longisporoflavus TaxID=28044 RepID=UPI0019C5B9ED|nr:hypothetical protein [Streptomyces longisporoflavus]GGV48477.1 hypothetical protein GCM10010277_41880 [Streptomyces longisporoflavus]